MSGFAAAVDPRPLPEGLVAAMSERIAHRGDDHQAVASAHGGGAIRTHPRGVYRAMASMSPERSVFFDGMLFNEAEILARHDTADLLEAIWQGFRKDGPAWFATLDGSFAIVIHDPVEARSHVVRDRFGARPLVVGLAGERVLFGSEIKALIADPTLPRVVNRAVLAEALRIGLVPGPATLLTGVYKALPGHVGTISASTFDPGSPFVTIGEEIDHDRTLGDLEGFLESSLRRTIAAYLVGDSRLGVQMSSGVDGAVLACLLSELAPASTHGVSFGATNWADEESGVAEDVARRLGIPFSRALVDEHFDALADLERAVSHIEEPTRFENAVALEVAQQAITGTVDAILTGEGAGVYLGTSLYWRAPLLARLWTVPDGLRRHLARAARRSGHRFDRLARHLAGNSFTDYYRSYFEWTPQLADVDLPSPTHERIQKLEGGLAHLPPASRCAQLESEAYQFLWVERMEQTGAAHGLDVLHPFLRNEIADYSLSTPQGLKVQQPGRITKPAIRNLAARYLGREFVQRPKKQLSAPMSLWLETSAPLRAAVVGLRAADSRWRGHLDAAMVESLLDDFEQTGAADRRTARGVHMLLSVEIWLRRFIDGPGPDPGGEL